MKNYECISVIVPNYNNGQYLESCLDSVLSQDYANLEVIVIDDSSTDGSGEIIRKYASRDARIAPVFNEKNLGVAVNRHNGIMGARGVYMTTLDSDDIFLRTDKLSREHEAMQAKVAAGIRNGIIFSGIVLLKADGSRLGAQAATIREGDILNHIVRRTCLIPRDFLFTREQYMAAGGFDPRIPIYEDWDLKIRLARKNLFYYSGIDGIGYRRHGTGLSSASPLYHAWWLGRIFSKNFFLLSSERRQTISMFSQLLWRMVRNHFKNQMKR
ncbi:MAG: glycosyltransferase family 2 protein [Desulfobulbaceae bacterium]